MFKNYLLVALRTLHRNKGYTLLNVVGLALGITCSLLLFLVIRHELSYDTFHTKADRIYRINVDKITQDGPSNSEGTPYPMLATIKASLPELTPATHIFNLDEGTVTVLSTDDKVPPQRFREEKNFLFVEPEFFDLFDFETGGVNAKQAIAEPNTALLTQSIAQKYFPGQNPVGRMLRLNNVVTLKVTGVIPDAPANTDLPFIMLVNYEASKKLNFLLSDNWNSTSSNHQVYFATAPGASPRQSEDRLNKITAELRKLSPGEKERYTFQPLSQVHFDERYSNFNNRTTHKNTLWALALVGLFLVLVASINFVNLATAQALRRGKEVGMRKVLGASKMQLMVQFLFETGLITMAAVLLSIVLAELLLPFLNQLLDLEISFSILSDVQAVFFLVGLLLVVTFFAGFYPALVLSGFQPISALKSKVGTARTAGLSLRRALVVVQFTICQVLIICTLVVHNQMEYFRSASLGFDKEALVSIPLPSGGADKLMALRPQLEAHSAIKSTSFALAPPSSNSEISMSFKFDDYSLERNFNLNFKIADEQYVKTFGIELLAGRLYEKSDTIREFLVNETFLKSVGITNPQEALGKKLLVNGGRSEGPIVGVVKDFHLGSLREKIAPVVIAPWNALYFSVSAKIEQKNVPTALAHLQKIYTATFPDEVFHYEFLDNAIAKFYEEEKRQAALFKIFSFIAIVIGCLGLYGLVAFMVNQRTKEVGVRKVLGASSASIVGLFCKDFAQLVLIAFIIAVPISYYFMEQWLQDFSYRINISYWAFLAAGALTLLIALTTVSVQALRAAFANPVLSLKTE